MNLQNDYKVLYEKAADGKRTFYASKTGIFADAEVIAEATIGEYKLIYEKADKIYGSTSGIPADNDYCFEAFNAVFSETASTVVDDAEPVAQSDEEDVVVEPEVDEPEADGADEPEDDEDLIEE